MSKPANTTESVELSQEQLSALLQGLRAVEDLFLGEELSEFLEYAAVPTKPFFEAVKQLRKMFK